MASRVVVYTSPGCHLCGPALDVVRLVRGDDFDVVDISADPELERLFRTRIPVVTVDGIERFQYHVDEEELRQLL